MNILLAEDSRSLASALQRVLEADGHTVQVVFDGIQALDALLRGGVDCVVCECHLPRMDGEAILHHAAAKGVKVACVAMVDAPTWDDAGGASDLYLSKPFGMDDMLASVRYMAAAHGQTMAGEITCDMDAKALCYRGKTVHMTIPQLVLATCLAQSDEPVPIHRLRELPLVGNAHNIYRLVAAINRRLERAHMGMTLVPVKNIGYEVKYV